MTFFFQHQGINGQEPWLPGQTFFGNLAGVPGADPSAGDINYVVSNSTDFLDRALPRTIGLHFGYKL